MKHFGTLQFLLTGQRFANDLYNFLRLFPFFELQSM